ncbi:MAG: type II toxin-antitoxin system VapC family toxin [Janthinobacterium lividum]
MMIDASAIVAILARQPGCEALLVRLDESHGPFLTTPVALLDATAALALVKGVTALELAREAVAEFSAALSLREVPISPDLGRRAMDRLVTTGGTPGGALTAVAAQAYRVPLLTA